VKWAITSVGRFSSSSFTHSLSVDLATITASWVVFSATWSPSYGESRMPLHDWYWIWRCVTTSHQCCTSSTDCQSTTEFSTDCMEFVFGDAWSTYTELFSSLPVWHYVRDCTCRPPLIYTTSFPQLRQNWESARSPSWVQLLGTHCWLTFVQLLTLQHSRDNSIFSILI